MHELEMNTKEVIEFLCRVPLLKRHSDSSAAKIAEVVIFKRYDNGEYIVREGETRHGVYFIYEGEAEVFGPIGKEEQGRSEFLLKQYDYFGQGLASAQEVSIITLSKLTCLMLPHEHCSLLKMKSNWGEDKQRLDHVMHVEHTRENTFEGISLPDSPSFGRVYGGQIVAQALAAAMRCVDCHKVVNSLHLYFHLPGDLNIPIIYEVHRVRDGKSFASRSVRVIQKGEVICSMIASFHKEDNGFDHQLVKMPSAPDPESLLSLEEVRERRLIDPRIHKSYRNRKAIKEYIPWPVDVKFCEPNHLTNEDKTPARMQYWFRARGKLSDNQAVHRCVVAYTSDLMFLTTSLNPHRGWRLNIFASTLDHSIWFHRSVKADDWLLFDIESPISHNGRGFVRGQIFNRKSELVASITQDGVTRTARPSSAVQPKL